MLDSIRDSPDAELCKHILAVVTIVRRPITLQELTSLVEMPAGVSDDQTALETVIGLCGSFLTIRNHTIYFVHQSAQDFLLGKALANAPEKASQLAFGWVFPSGIEDVDYIILSRSLSTMSQVLRRDMYGLGKPGFSINNLQSPDPDPLAAVRYSCVYWIDHLCRATSGTSTRQDVLELKVAVSTFFETKCLYWLEALSLLRAMPEGVAALRQLDRLLAVSVRSRDIPLEPGLTDNTAAS